MILGQGSPELKTYLSVGQVALLAFAVPYYGRLAARLDRRALLNTVTYFFVACGTQIGLTASGFARVNVLLAAGFLTLAVLVGRAYAGRTASAATAASIRTSEVTS